ncbi:MAG: hypothetical protein HFP77_00705 [Methylococcales symbiont of Iophon sp. n. MRB-2018]|nr:MAG: hypothetical protein HFP77_00705 [Methylococcales symbiont of Iophon sp. n. MRB-2018]
MNQIIDTICKVVEDLERNGHSVIGTHELKVYLSKLSAYEEKNEENELTSAELEKYKADLSKGVEDHKIHNQWGFELFRATLLTGQSALKSAILINGGASIALLTFIGNVKDNSITNVAQLAEPLEIFLLGVLLAAIASGATYLAQWFFASRIPWQRIGGNVSNVTAILFVLGSYGSFLCGVLQATHIFGT